MKTEREFFEKEFTSSSLFVLDFGCSDRAFRKNGDGDYYYTSVQGAWQIWQASANREGYKLVPVEATNKMIVAMENKVQEQLDASAITADMFRLDGERIFEAMINAID